MRTVSSPWESHRDPSSSEPANGSGSGSSGSGAQDAPTPHSPPAPYQDPSAPDSQGLAPYSDPYRNDPAEPYSSSGDGPSPYGPAGPYDSGYGSAPYGQDQYGQNPYGANQYGASQYGQNPYGGNQYGQNPYGGSQYGQNQYAQPAYGQSQYGQPYPGPYAQSYPPTRPVSGLAVAALVCGIVGFFTAGIASIPAVICGHMAWRETSSGTHSGHGMAIAGLVLGYLQIVGWALFWLILIGSVAAA
jgi:hypothetical protein